MGESIPCPVCTLYLHPGMSLAEHLETHPKEQVIKALVNLAIKGGGAGGVDTSALFASQSSKQEKPTATSVDKNVSGGMSPSPPPPTPPLNPNASLDKLNQSSLPPPPLEKMFLSSNSGMSFPPMEPKNLMIVKRQNTVYQSTDNAPQYNDQMGSLSEHGGNAAAVGLRIPPSSSQIYAYQQQNPKPLQPPPAYGAAISQLRSQNSQNYINSGRQNYQNNFSPSCFLSNPASLSSNSTTVNHTQGTLDYSLSKFNMSPLQRNSLGTGGLNLASPRQVHSPRLATPSPSVLRFADSPVTAHYVERDNGDFLVQETPKHVVECVEKDDGEFAVVEKVISSPPSIVQINPNDESDLEEEAEIKIEPTVELNLKAKPKKSGGITVISDVQVQLDMSEYLDLVENMFTSSNPSENAPIRIKEEKMECKDIDFTSVLEKTDNSSTFSVASSISATTSVIRLATPSSCIVNSPTKRQTAKNNNSDAPNVSAQNISTEPSSQTPNAAVKEASTSGGGDAHSSTSAVPISRRSFKKTPKKLVIKSKQGNTLNKTTETKTSYSDEIKTERFSPIPGPSRLTQEETLNLKGHNNSIAVVEQKHSTDTSVVVDDADDDVEMADIKLDCNIHEETILDSSNLNKSLMEDIPIVCLRYDISSNYNNDSSSIHVNFPTSSSSTDESKYSSTREFELAAVNPETEIKDSKFASILEKCIKTDEDIKFSDKELVVVTTTKSSKAKSSDIQSASSVATGAQSFPSSALFSKPSTSSSALRADANNENDPQPATNYSDYPFSYLYASPQPVQSPCVEEHVFKATIFQSQIQEFEDEEKNCYLDLDACKMSTSVQDSLSMAVALNIQTDEKMPAKGEISEQESNGDIENSWSQPVYNELACRFPNPYEGFLSRESWSLNPDEYFHAQDLSSAAKPKSFSNPIATAVKPPEATPSTSAKKSKTPTSTVVRKKSFQCEHCRTIFPKLKERNTHMIDIHGYTRLNRRLYREPPAATVTSATVTASIPEVQLEAVNENAESSSDVKLAIVKIEPAQSEETERKVAISTVSSTSTRELPRTKYDSIRAGVYRMLMNFNLSVLKQNKNIEADKYLFESKSFCCYTCKQDFISVKLFDEHLATHPAECFTCGKKFSRWTYFSVHLKRHLGWKDFGCNVCGKKFVVRSALVEHSRMHTGVAPLKCKHCCKQFKRYSNLTQHVKNAHSTSTRRKKEYVCHCGEVLASKARFVWHKETHDPKPKCCPWCRERFIHANSLRRHIRLAHSDKFVYTQPMECPICKQVFSKASIKAHMATHSMDTQHECNICNKSFSTKWNLKIHSWVHANRTAKPFKCEHCVKAFVREVDFKNHMNSHKQIKPYTCEYCGCKFIRKYNYMRHRREHHGEKKFSCDLCGRLFHRRYYLIEHRRIHTGERPFLCTICGKSSTTKTNHNKHLKIHHSRDPFTSET